MIKVIILSALISFLLSGCSFRQEIERSIKPKEKYGVEAGKDGYAACRDGTMELSVEPVSDNHWQKLLGFECFKNRKSTSSSWRTPKLLFHHLTIKNTGTGPVRIAGIKIGYGQAEKSAISSGEIKKICKSPAYSMIDFTSLVKSRRILGRDISLNDIDFDRDTIEYRLDFIGGGDLISRMIAFEWIPVEFRTYKITLQLETLGDIKIINLEFNRMEYHESGPFSRPEEDDLEDELW